MVINPGFFEVGEAKFNSYKELLFQVRIKNDEKRTLVVSIDGGWVNSRRGIESSDLRFLTVKTTKLAFKPGEERTITMSMDVEKYKQAIALNNNKTINPALILQTADLKPVEGTGVNSAFTLPVYVYKTITSKSDSTIQPALTLTCDGQKWIFWPEKISCVYKVVNNPVTSLRLRNQLTIKRSQLNKSTVTTELLDKHRVFLPQEEIEGVVEVKLRPFARNQLQLVTIVSNDQTSWRLASAPLDRIYLPWYTGSLLLALLLAIIVFIGWRFKRKAKKHGKEKP